MLVGNTFPLSLIRREVTITQVPLEYVKKELQTKSISSYWGHSNTLDVASRILDKNVTPEIERPALMLSKENYPMLNGRTFRECWVLSPDYKPGFRPKAGDIVQEPDIIGWQILHLKW